MPVHEELRRAVGELGRRRHLVRVRVRDRVGVRVAVRVGARARDRVAFRVRLRVAVRVRATAKRRVTSGAVEPSVRSREILGDLGSSREI